MEEGGVTGCMNVVLMGGVIGVNGGMNGWK